jgi:hypothetical protein
MVFLLVPAAAAASGPAGTAPRAVPDGTPVPRGVDDACASGRLTVGALPAIDAAWEAGLAAATERATAWHPEARLVAVQVTCRFLDPGFAIRATFYADKMDRSLYESDDGAVTALDPDVPPPTSLPVDGLSFRLLADALAEAGYPPTTELSPAGVAVRYNQDDPAWRFGPEMVPTERTLFHVATEQDNQTQDLFVDAEDGTIYRYRRDEPAPGTGRVVVGSGEHGDASRGRRRGQRR